MARTFRSGETADKLTMPDLASWTQRSYSVWAKPSGWGTLDMGHVFRWAAPFEIDLLSLRLSHEQWDYVAFFNSNNGQWHGGNVLLNEWQHVAVVYDAGSTANKPAIYLNGAAQTITELSTPAGVTRVGTGPRPLGNNVSSVRQFHGDLARFASWNGLLTAAEVLQLSRGIAAAQLRTSAVLMEDVEILGGESAPRDRKRGVNGTLTGTVAADHPPGLTFPDPGGRRRRAMVVVPPEPEPDAIGGRDGSATHLMLMRPPAPVALADLDDDDDVAESLAWLL